MSKVMAVNAGSSSLKFKLFLMPQEEVLTEGIVERIGMEDAYFTIKVDGEKRKQVLPIKDHQQAVDMLLKALVENHIVEDLKEINGVGHRVLHGGEKYPESVVCTPEVAQDILDMKDLGPLHMVANYTGYAAFHNALPEVGHVTVYDTSFHLTMKPEVYLYPIPLEYYEKYKVRKYGFHGTSHKYITYRYAELKGKDVKDSNIITCHLGNGASLAAIKAGEVVNTSMGFTPLAGIMMGGRSGDVDPSIIPYLMEKTGQSAEELINTFNKKSGLLGISGVSSDARDIQAAIDKGNERAVLARKIYAQRVSSFIGSYYVQLGHTDAIIFTAGLGENDKNVRSEICELLTEALGITIDEEVNANARGKEIRISTPDSKVEVWVIPTDEEIMIARDTVRLLHLD
ncbi:MAG: acetate kinase [Erysipelotrichaceae bacterium]|nr:acetate kinase [Erysipelotrichaceae bacterium]MBO4537674.1 acetate kinase [Erysipelotrichaceae bacterium]MBR5049527.1 acetate kinase [Erysipelotrichaceae bacterium]